MDFNHYTSQPVWLAVDLVNTLHPVTNLDVLTTEEDLRQFLITHEEIYTVSAEEMAEHPDYQLAKGLYREGIQGWEINSDDVLRVRAVRSSLRSVFEQVTADEPAAVILLNEQLRISGATPRISSHHGPLHLHFETAEAGCSHWLAATTVMGLVIVLCDFGGDRFGICASPSCKLAFIDTSKNMRKQYCSEACAHRESVAAFRARRRASSTT